MIYFICWSQRERFIQNRLLVSYLPPAFEVTWISIWEPPNILPISRMPTAGPTIFGYPKFRFLVNSRSAWSQVNFGAGDAEEFRPLGIGDGDHPAKGGHVVLCPVYRRGGHAFTCEKHFAIWWFCSIVIYMEVSWKRGTPSSHPF